MILGLPSKLLKRPLDDWDNPGLMISESRRDELSADFPWATKLIDWPEFRRRFAEHDAQANRLRRYVRWQGLGAILLSVAGLLVAALIPVLASNDAGVVRTLSILAAGFAGIGGVLGLEHLMSGRLKQRWLFERLITERLRQLYFQTIYANAPLLLKARGPEEAVEWNDVRAQALSWFFESYVSDRDIVMKSVADDLLNQHAWLNREASPEITGRPVDEAERLQELSEFLEKQRLDVQLAYVEAKVAPGPHSPSTGATLARTAANILALFTIGSALIVGILYATGSGASSSQILWTVSLQAAGCAMLAGVRVLDDGLAFTGETELYKWYAAATVRTKEKLPSLDPLEKLRLMSGFEQIAYEEFRIFFTSHDDASFLI